MSTGVVVKNEDMHLPPGVGATRLDAVRDEC
jgi:hypothetical protein